MNINTSLWYVTLTNVIYLFISSFITQIIYNNSMIKVLGIKNNSHRPFILKYSNSDYIYILNMTKILFIKRKFTNMNEFKQV